MTVPSRAEVIFGDRLELAESYVELLRTTGIDHGLLGPREADRLWDRHVLNCAVIAGAFAPGADLVDVGSGAGLPGLVLAIARPDLRVQLVEPLGRRVVWLNRTVDALELPNVEVHQGRAQDFWGRLSVPYVTARAVARIDRLARWTLPLLREDGVLLAVKGATAAAELAAERQTLMDLGATAMRLDTYGEGIVDPPTQLVRVRIGAAIPSGRMERSKTRGASRRRHRPG